MQTKRTAYGAPPIIRERIPTVLVDMRIQAYVINLDKDSERLNSVKPELAKFNLPFQKIIGVPGSALHRDEKQRLASTLCNAFCTPSMIGCAASHLKTWKTFLHESSGDVALICEDDIRVMQDARRQLHNALKEVPSTFDLLYAGCLQCHPTSSSWSAALFRILTAGKIGNEKSEILTQSIYVPQLALGTHCYLVSRRGAKKLIAIFEQNISYHVDVQINANFRDLEVYAMHPPVAHQTFATNSSNNVSQYPALLNSAIKNWTQGGIPGPYVMSAPGGQVFGCVVTNWLVALCFVSVLMGLCARKRSDVWYGMVVITLVVTIPDILSKSMKNHWHFPLLMWGSYAGIKNI